MIKVQVAVLVVGTLREPHSRDRFSLLYVQCNVSGRVGIEEVKQDEDSKEGRIRCCGDACFARVVFEFFKPCKTPFYRRRQPGPLTVCARINHQSTVGGSRGRGLCAKQLLRHYLILNNIYCWFSNIQFHMFWGPMCFYVLLLATQSCIFTIYLRGHL
jgi:hypothetical protein